VVAEVGADSLGHIKSKLGADFSFLEIRAVTQYERFLQRLPASAEEKK
jgi:hypothetical protein